MNLTLHVWRQASAKSRGRFVSYPARDISPDMSFLEMLDVVNEELIKKGQDPIAFDHDCREGICGTCSIVINGSPHGPLGGVTACQLHCRIGRSFTLTFASFEIVELSSWLFARRTLRPPWVSMRRSYFGLPQFCPFQPSGMPVLPSGCLAQSSTTSAPGSAARRGAAARSAAASSVTAARSPIVARIMSALSFSRRPCATVKT